LSLADGGLPGISHSEQEMEFRRMGLERGGGSRWFVCLWPGLAQAWFDGAWSGLALAVAFGCLLDMLLVTSLVWTELADQGVRVAAWTAVTVFWVASAVSGWRWCLRSGAAGEAGTAEDLFPRALGEYLRGHWFEAEALCLRLLGRDSRDVEAQLLLATVCRQTRRFDEARRRLAELGQLEAAARWQLEIEGELARVAEGQGRGDGDGDGGAGLSAQNGAKPLSEMREAA